MENLLENASKYSTPNTLIKILISEKEHFLRVAVCDIGDGIPKCKRQQIFNLYESSRGQSKGEVEGLGLGLPISYQIVQLHGGSLRCWSRMGKGSIFIVRIPSSQV